MNDLEKLQADLDECSEEIVRRCDLIRERLEGGTSPYLVGALGGIEDQTDRLRHILDGRNFGAVR